MLAGVIDYYYWTICSTDFCAGSELNIHPPRSIYFYNLFYLFNLFNLINYMALAPLQHMFIHLLRAASPNFAAMASLSAYLVVENRKKSSETFRKVNSKRMMYVVHTPQCMLCTRLYLSTNHINVVRLYLSLILHTNHINVVT